MNVEINGAPIYFTIPILGGIPITATLVVTWGVMLVLTLLCIWLTHDLKVRDISRKQAVAEKLVLTAENFVRTNMGDKWMHFAPFVGTIFAMSLSCSLSSLLGLWAPTGEVSTTMAWAIVVFVIIGVTPLLNLVMPALSINRFTKYLRQFTYLAWTIVGTFCALVFR